MEKVKTYICYVSVSPSVLLNPAPAPPEGGGTDGGDSDSTADDLVFNIWSAGGYGQDYFITGQEVRVPIEITRQQV